MSLGCEGHQVPSPRHWDKSWVEDMPCDQRKRSIRILAPGKSVPIVASSPYGQQPFSPGAPGHAFMQSPVQCKELSWLPCTPWLPPVPSLAQSLSGHAWWHAEPRGRLRQVRSHRLWRICSGWVRALYVSLLSVQSQPQGLPQGLSDLYCRSTPKAFTSILNGLISYLSFSSPGKHWGVGHISPIYRALGRSNSS